MEEITAINTWKRRVGQRRGMGNVHVGRFFFVLRVLPLGYTILLHRFSRVPAIKTEGLFSESCSRGGKQERERERERAMGEYDEKKRERFSLKLKMGEHVRD